MKISIVGKMDKVGFAASALCAVHCALMPFIITLLPFAGLGFLSSPWVEAAVIALSVIIGVSSLVPSFLKYHHKPLPIIVLLFGFLLIFGTHLSGSHQLEPVLVPLGGACVATAHIVNWKLNKPFHRHHHHGGSLS